MRHIKGLVLAVARAIALVGLIAFGTVFLAPGPATAAEAQAVRDGYWLVASDGGVFTFGPAGFFGSLGGASLNRPIVGLTSTPSGRGYWLVAADGGVFTFGDARFFGSTGAMQLNQPIVGMAATIDGGGYVLLGADGGVFTFGDATFHGSGVGRIASPAVAISEDPGGGGYRILSEDGNVFPFDVPDLGGDDAARSPAVGMAVTPEGGYRLAFQSGGVATSGSPRPTTSGPEVDLYGDATGTAHAPIVGITSSSDGKGYLLLARDGGVFTFGDATFYGSASGLRLKAPVVGGATAGARRPA